MRLKNSIYNICFLLLQQLIVTLYGLIVPALTIKVYGSNVNGTIASINQFLSYISLLEAGVGGVVLSALYKPLAQKNNDTISGIIVATENFFKKLAGIFLVYLIFIAIGYPFLVSKEFSWIYTFFLIVIMGAGTFAQYYFGITYQLLLEADQKNRVVACIQIISTLSVLIITLFCIYARVSIHVLKIITSLVYVLRPLALNYYVRKHYKINKTVKSDNESLKQRWDSLAHHIAYIIHYNTDITVLTIFTNVMEVSVYSVYYNIISNIYKIISSISSGIKASVGNMIACEKMDLVRQALNEFETLYFIIINILYSSTMTLIIPFINIYTSGVRDANYIRPVFGIILACAEVSYALRNPYDMIIFGAGHFKQTKKGAYEEAIINIVLSVILVNRFGIIGVALGTFVAMLFRVFQYVWYLKNNILFRSPIIFIKKLIINVLIGIIVITSFQTIDYVPHNYFEWFKYASIVFGLTSVAVVSINALFYKKEMLEILYRLYKKK